MAVFKYIFCVQGESGNVGTRGPDGGVVSVLILETVSVSLVILFSLLGSSR